MSAQHVPCMHKTCRPRGGTPAPPTHLAGRGGQGQHGMRRHARHGMWHAPPGTRARPPTFSWLAGRRPRAPVAANARRGGGPPAGAGPCRPLRWQQGQTRGSRAGEPRPAGTTYCMQEASRRSDEFASSQQGARAATAGRTRGVPRARGVRTRRVKPTGMGGREKRKESSPPRGPAPASSGQHGHGRRGHDMSTQHVPCMHQYIYLCVCRSVGLYRGM